jgi:hypothetical protein
MDIHKSINVQYAVSSEVRRLRVLAGHCFIKGAQAPLLRTATHPDWRVTCLISRKLASGSPRNGSFRSRVANYYFNNIFKD